MKKRDNSNVNRLFQIANQLSDERECDKRAIALREVARDYQDLIERHERYMAANPATSPAPTGDKQEDAIS